MGIPSILSLFLLLHILFLHSSGKCPESFNCGTHGKIRFPLSNTTFPLCGLYTVQNCTDPVPKLNLGTPGVLYDLNSTNVQENSVRVDDPRLGNLIRTNGCDIFSFYLNWTLPVRPPISFTISPGITLFKCTTISPELDKQQESYFHGSNNYSGCSGYTVYHKYLHHYPVQSNGSFPRNCSVIELPVGLKPGNRNTSDLFSVLASEFSIKFNVSKECLECHRKGGLCDHDGQHFSCEKVKEGTSKLRLILGTVIPGVVILLLCLVIVIWRCKKWNNVSSYINSKKSSCDLLSKVDIEGGSAYFGASVFSYAELEQATHDFDPSKELGDGGFGTVYHGKLRDGREVAVKRLYERNYKRVKQFMNEIKILTYLSHPNLVTLFGCTSRHSRELLLVYEYIPNGTVADHLHDSSIERMTFLVAEVAFRCLQLDKDIRPTMEEIFEALKEIQAYKDENAGKIIDDGSMLTSRRPTSSSDLEDIVLLKNTMAPISPASVTDTWVSTSTTSALSDTPSISYTISPNLTLLKCMTNNVELQLQTAKYFRDNSNYSSYKGCHNYTVFYSYPNPPVQVLTQGSYPPNCAAFQLPLVSPFAEQNLEDPFSLLASDYSITFHVSEECQACRLKGSQCPLDSQEFLCLKKRGDLHSLFLFYFSRFPCHRKLGWDALYQIAVGIARGLEYLHCGCNTQILHFDIKPHNILLNEDFCPKIADFGLAKLCPQKESIISLVGARGTAGYIGPEVFSRNFGGVSHKSDVYSYGMMVLEMVGARKNTSVEVDRTSEIYFPHWVYKRLELDEELELHGVVDDKANGTVRKMIIVGLWCIQIDPSH
ncbi:hypothetical protein Vadar_018636 [Vaccinium darrowii]|uniref:Uncharacterized protein n=1 Tax=Vaccinium darrowii TaxID=229202 RepID=A0ACB7XIE7_9ERIC|nr:hypothetical protein Vadar_018636 [Vaccinium darrowii]